MVEGVNSSMIYLIYCKNFCKCHSTLPNTTIKKENFKKWNKMTTNCHEMKNWHILMIQPMEVCPRQWHKQLPYSQFSTWNPLQKKVQLRQALLCEDLSPHNELGTVILVTALHNGHRKSCCLFSSDRIKELTLFVYLSVRCHQRHSFWLLYILEIEKNFATPEVMNTVFIIPYSLFILKLWLIYHQFTRKIVNYSDVSIGQNMRGLLIILI
jgi:hypothetical protein